MSNLAQRIYELRTGRGLKQDELAEALGVSRQAVSKWEMGTGVPTLENLVALSEYFGVSLDSLVKDSPAEKAPEPEEMRDFESAEISPSQFEFSPVPKPRTETLPPLKTVINSALLVAACLFTYFIANGIEYLLTMLFGNLSLGSLISYTKFQPFIDVALNFAFSFPLYYFMTAVFRDGACLINGGKSGKSRIPPVIALWAISSANTLLSALLVDSPGAATYALRPFLGVAVYLIFYLLLARAEGFRRSPQVLIPALFAMIAAAAGFSALLFTTSRRTDITMGERLAEITWILRISAVATSIISLVCLNIIYDGRKRE